MSRHTGHDSKSGCYVFRYCSICLNIYARLLERRDSACEYLPPRACGARRSGLGACFARIARKTGTQPTPGGSRSEPERGGERSFTSPERRESAAPATRLLRDTFMLTWCCCSLAFSNCSGGLLQFHPFLVS